LAPPKVGAIGSVGFSRRGDSVVLVNAGRIRHTVVFRLRHPEGSPEEREFFEALRSLTEIPGVEAFEILREVSPMNDYSFGLSMEFSGADVYAAYNEHPAHTRFVEERWLAEVSDFLEIDYRALPGTAG
jgi:Stress responsive A/B Barrel Domain